MLVSPLLYRPQTRAIKLTFFSGATLSDFRSTVPSHFLYARVRSSSLNSPLPPFYASTLRARSPLTLTTTKETSASHSEAMARKQKQTQEEAPAESSQQTNGQNAKNLQAEVPVRSISKAAKSKSKAATNGDTSVLSTTRRRSTRVSTASENHSKNPPLVAAAEQPSKAPSKRKKKVPDQDTSNPPSSTTTSAPPSTPNAKKPKVAVTAPAGHLNTPTRPAEPHVTNAPLKTPGGSKVVAYPPGSVDFRGSNLPKPTTTTKNLLEEAVKHLVSVDPKLQKLVDKHHCKVFSPEGLQEVEDPFEALCRSIISQQVSGAAATSIRNKFISLFPSAPLFPTPSTVASTDLTTLRTAGLSQRKAEYIQGLAEKFASGELSAQMLIAASDEELMEKLVAVRGLGRWTVEMFACFALKRCDVFSLGDLGVQRGMAAWLGKDVGKLRNKGGKWKYLSEQDMITMSDKFRPYRSVFMWYMWRADDVDVQNLEGA